MSRLDLRIRLPLDCRGHLSDSALANRRSLEAEAEVLLIRLLRRRAVRQARGTHTNATGRTPRADLEMVPT
jgi:hypothetical protein